MTRRPEKTWSEEEALAQFMKHTGWSRERSVAYIEAAVRAGELRPLNEDGQELTEEERAVWKFWRSLN